MFNINIFRKLLLKEQNTESKETLEFHSCLLINISSCEYTENNIKFVVTLYNPSSQPLTTYVRLPVKGTTYRVKDYLGNLILLKNNIAGASHAI